MSFRFNSLSATLFISALLISNACSSITRRDVSPSVANKNENYAPPDGRKLNIYENEAVPKGAQAVLSGTIENTTDAPLSRLSVQIELKKRNADERETRTVKVAPEQLAPGARGIYTLNILAREWGSSRILGVLSETQADTLAYTILPGNKRPLERPPAGKTIVIDKPASPRTGNDGFINTPDTPYAVP